MTTTTASAPVRYLAPGWFTRKVFNPIFRNLARAGVSIRGSAELSVVGRRSGQVRTTVLNPLTFAGHEYLVAPRGTTEWVRNLRAAGSGELRVGRRRSPFTAVEVADADKVPVLREYVRRWKAEVGQFFDGIDASSSDAELAAIAPGFPVFEISRR